MALIIDPDDLNQGTENVVADLAFTASAGATTTLTGATTLPAIAAGEFFEIRDSSTPGNNGLYLETGGSPTTSSITCDKVVGSDPQDLVAESTSVFGETGVGSEKSVHFDTPTLEFYLIEQGNLSVDGVTMLALHSFKKKRWKDDDFLISAAGFPMVGISFAAGQWVFGQDPSGNNNGWKPAENVTPVSGAPIQTRRLIRNAGWDEINASGNTLRKYFNVTTLPTSGAFEDSADQAYYRFGSDATDLAAAVDFEFTGEVNEPVKYFEEIGNPGTLAFAATTITRVDSGGSFVTDGYQVGGQVTIRAAEDSENDTTETLTAVSATVLTAGGASWTVNADDTTVQLAVDNDNAFTAFLRIRDADPSGKTFASANLAAGGETEITSKIIKLGLANATDLDIDETDANIAANEPYTEIRLRYLDAAYNREVDSGTPRNFGIIADVGTYSRQNGVSATSTLFTSADHVLGLGEDLADYAGGSLIIHEGTDQGTHVISGTPNDNAGTLEITLTIALTATETILSFTMQRSTPIVGLKQEVYEKIHYQLRQAADVDGTQNVVNGKTADDLALFVGPDLRLGSLTPTNPNGGGSGVLIEGFDTNDTNNLFFFDNGGTSRNFPFVAAGNIVVNQGLVDDTDGEAWLYFEYTDRVTNATIDAASPSGDTYDLQSDAAVLGVYAVNDYIQISGFAQAANNGLFIVTVVNVSQSDYTVRKVDGTDVGTAETNQTVTVDQNPYPSPDALVVNDNGGSPVAFDVSALSTAWDFDYENNVQGGRTADTDAAVVLVVGGLETGQIARTPDGANTITKTTGQAFNITSPLERNFTP